MGGFSPVCALTGVPILEGMPVGCVVLMRGGDDDYDWHPVSPVVWGKYDGYRGVTVDARSTHARDHVVRMLSKYMLHEEGRAPLSWVDLLMRSAQGTLSVDRPRGKNESIAERARELLNGECPHVRILDSITLTYAVIYGVSDSAVARVREVLTQSGFVCVEHPIHGLITFPGDKNVLPWWNLGVLHASRHDYARLRVVYFHEDAHRKMNPIQGVRKMRPKLRAIQALLPERVGGIDAGDARIQLLRDGFWIGYLSEGFLGYRIVADMLRASPKECLYNFVDTQILVSACAWYGVHLHPYEHPAPDTRRLEKRTKIVQSLIGRLKKEEA
ncbi:hypothetical protein EBT31_07490 [bacterium]|nr:hypothetical protein [bacterium]